MVIFSKSKQNSSVPFPTSPDSRVFLCRVCLTIGAESYVHDTDIESGDSAILARKPIQIISFLIYKE